ncbi:MAG: NUDIX hydrolase [Brevibacterium aurantiacum]|uniref:NUDIX domain-containing protein n=1 Tax=Brevibacterium aurantiacum TaxID=273384 RepID=A0A2A3X7N9_BREAU|nr:NUDIX hydrolase [Brevibacterium aurantiacum]MDN5609301.1 NUDIX hydrolase [Brevibacterium sp.]AZL09138.1 NUDIX domain-containing protein [Brevibacterium aurantiacum]AZL12749.1 NUDIX domain-containing protein [Brevibacterium aurantiacum]AZT97030.1 NUDIX domain-containing protein [Brevibacterium aurantiacum]MDN5662096.1 NUDIX hydrolase [Brevibacterium aurantiacum]
MHFSDYDTRLAGYAVIVNDDREILLSWFNGGNEPAHALWTLPGGGIEFHESIETGTIREIKEETGFDAELVRPLTTHTFTENRSSSSRRRTVSRPFKGVRVVYEARITGGTLGTLEVDGTTDRAEWLALDSLAEVRHARIIDIGLDAWRTAV